MGNLKGEGRWLIPLVISLFVLLFLFTPEHLSWVDRMNLWTIIFLAGLLVGMVLGIRRLPHG
jgi:hypothetical protein